MRNHVNAAAALRAVTAALACAGLLLWRFADTRPPAAAVSAHNLLGNPTVQAAVMDSYRTRYNARFGGSYGR